MFHLRSTDWFSIGIQSKERHWDYNLSLWLEKTRGLLYNKETLQTLFFEVLSAACQFLSHLDVRARTKWGSGQWDFLGTPTNRGVVCIYIFTSSYLQRFTKKNGHDVKNVLNLVKQSFIIKISLLLLRGKTKDFFFIIIQLYFLILVLKSTIF